MGIFKRKGCAIWSPNFVLSAGFETLCLPSGNDLCEFTVMWDDTQTCWSASARGASQRIMLQDLAWHDCWVNQQLSGCNLPMKRKAMLNSWAAGQSERVSPCSHHRNREWSKLQGTPGGHLPQPSTQNRLDWTQIKVHKVFSNRFFSRDEDSTCFHSSTLVPHYCNSEILFCYVSAWIDIFICYKECCLLCFAVVWDFRGISVLPPKE